MWQRWKAGAGMALRLFGILFTLQFVLLPAFLFWAMGRAAGPGITGFLMTGLTHVYAVIAIPLVLPSIIEGFGLRRMTAAEAEHKRREAVERKQEELRQEGHRGSQQ
ncbi:MAG: hypothetical protein R6U98_33450 [Pirellulaceae bacterium]